MVRIVILLGHPLWEEKDLLDSESANSMKETPAQVQHGPVFEYEPKNASSTDARC